MASVPDIRRLKTVLGFAYFGLACVFVGSLLILADNLFIEPSRKLSDWISLAIAVPMLFFAVYLIKGTRSKIRLAETA